MWDVGLGELFDSEPESQPKKKNNSTSSQQPYVEREGKARRRRRKVVSRLEKELQAEIASDRKIIINQRLNEDTSAHLPDWLLADQENEEGSCEYKWRLIKLSDTRFEELVTQMKYRLAEGDGQCRYEVGLEDNGLARGLSEEDLAESISNVKRMAAAIDCTCEVVQYSNGLRGRLASLVVKQIVTPQQRHEWNRVPDARIAMLGSSSCGKSTLLAVLASNRLDDAHGTQRSMIFRYPHEVVSGCTSAISRHLVGFDETGHPVSLINRNDVSVPSAQDEEEVLNAKSLLQLVDLPGARKYLRTTFRGLLSTRPDFLILCVDAASMLSTPQPEEIWNIKLAEELRWRAVITLTKCDNLSSDELELARANASEWSSRISGPDSNKPAPIVCVSSVTGAGLSELRTILAEVGGSPNKQLPAGGACFLVQDIWPRQDADLPVVGGMILNGSLRVGMKVSVGPVNARVRSIQVFRKNVQQVDKPGLACTVALETFHAKRRVEESEASTCSDSETDRSPGFRVGDFIWELGKRPAFPQDFTIQMSPIFGREELLKFSENGHRRLLLHAHGARCEIEVVSSEGDQYRCRFSWGREFLEPGMPMAVTSALSSDQGGVMAVGYINTCK